MNKFTQLVSDIGKLWAKYGSLYISGIEKTLILALVATVIGCIIGFICGVLNTIPCGKNDSPVKRFFVGLVRVIVRIYVEVFRGTPMMLQAVFMYDGQTEGAKAIGMTHVQTMMSVILPQALRNIMPQIGNNFIINVKDTSVMFIIGFSEFFAAHRAAVGASYLYFPSATVEMVGYLTMTLLASFLLRLVEKKLDGSGSYELASGDQLVMAAGTYSHPDHGTPFDERSTEFDEKALRRDRSTSARGEK